MIDYQKVCSLWEVAGVLDKISHLVTDSFLLWLLLLLIHLDYLPIFGGFWAVGATPSSA